MPGRRLMDGIYSDAEAAVLDLFMRLDQDTAELVQDRTYESRTALSMLKRMRELSRDRFEARFADQLVATCTEAAVTNARSIPDLMRLVCAETEGYVAEAIEVIRAESKASTSLLQRRLRWGYLRAAHVLEILESRGMVGPGDGAKPREILQLPEAVAEKSGRAGR